MKRFLLTGLFLSVNIVQAAERPIWEDNCPQGLDNAVYKEIQWYWPDSTRSTQEIYNYWAKRRVEFYERLNKCDGMPDEVKDSCYDTIRAKQAVDNEIYQNNIEQKKVSSQVWKDTNKTNNWVMFNILR